MNYLLQLENTLNEYFSDKAPALPTNVKDIIVKIIPWINLIIFVVTLPAVFLIFSIGTLFSPVVAISNPHSTPSYFLALLFLIAAEILWGLAIPGLFKFLRKSWRFIFWGQLLNCIYSLITNFNLMGIIFLIITSAISFYFLFQIRDRFNK